MDLVGVYQRNKYLLYNTVLMSVFLFIYIHPLPAMALEQIVLTDDMERTPIGLSLEVLEDSDGKLTIEEVSSPQFEERFIVSRKKAPNYGYTDSTYWVRFLARKKATHTGPWVVELGFANVHHIDYYSPNAEGNGFVAFKTGILEPVDTRDINFHRFAFNLDIPSDAPKSIYLRIKSEASMTLNFSIQPKHRFDQEARKELLLKGIFYGILLIMGCYNLFLYVSLRDITYLWFALFLAIVTWFLAGYDGIGPLYIWPKHMTLSHMTPVIAFILTPIFMLLFVCSFLSTSTQAYRIHRIILIQIYMWALLLILTPILGYSFLITERVVFWIVTFISMGLAGIIVWLKGYRPARFFLLAWLILVVQTIIAVLVRLRMLPSTGFSEYGYHIGFTWMVLFWSLALADRINLIKKETENAHSDLKRERDINKELFLENPAFIVAVDAEWRILMMNRTMLKSLGYRFSEIVKRNYLAIFVPEEYRKAHSEILKSLTSTKKSTIGETRIITKDGKKRHVEWHISQILDEKGQSEFFFGMGIDITERKKTEGELATYRHHLEELVKERTIELENTQTELIKSERLAVLGRLIETICHELRNPLGVIRSSIFYLQNRIKTEDDKNIKHFYRIDEQINQCNTIMEDLMEYSRGRKSSVIPREINPFLKKIVENPVSENEKNISVTMGFSPGLPLALIDEEKLGLAVENILQNAVNAVQAKKVDSLDKDIHYQPHIEIKTSKVEKGLHIEISDNGIGMDIETQNQAFEPLFTTKTQGSTGLGLAISKKIIEEHNGVVSIESEPNLGTRVSFVIPGES